MTFRISFKMLIYNIILLILPSLAFPKEDVGFLLKEYWTIHNVTIYCSKMKLDSSLPPSTVPANQTTIRYLVTLLQSTSVHLCYTNWLTTKELA